MEERRRILADEAKEFAERQLPADWEVKLEAYRGAEVSRLTDCLEETIDELLCGNRLYAQLTDRQNDAEAFLELARNKLIDCRAEIVDRGNSITELSREVEQLEQSVKSKQVVLDATLRANQAAEQARLEAVRELEQTRKKLETALTACANGVSRLSRAEEALRQEWLDAPDKRGHWWTSPFVEGRHVGPWVKDVIDFQRPDRGLEVVEGVGHSIPVTQYVAEYYPEAKWLFISEPSIKDLQPGEPKKC